MPLLIAFAYCFKFFSPCSNLDHIECRIRIGPGRLTLDIFLCVTIPFVSCFGHIVVPTDRRIWVLLTLLCLHSEKWCCHWASNLLVNFFVVFISMREKSWKVTKVRTESSFSLRLYIQMLFQLPLFFSFSLGRLNDWYDGRTTWVVIQITRSCGSAFGTVRRVWDLVWDLFEHIDFLHRPSFLSVSNSALVSPWKSFLVLQDRIRWIQYEEAKPAHAWSWI